MPESQIRSCACCGAEISTKVPDYYIEIECFRLMSERIKEMPRRGSKEYHEAMEKLLPEVRQSYYQNPEMYNQGHLWCPVCGSRLIPGTE